MSISSESDQSVSSHGSTTSDSLSIDDLNFSDSDAKKANKALIYFEEVRKFASDNLSEDVQKRMKDLHRDMKREINQKK